jgi:hypothetical protein
VNRTLRGAVFGLASLCLLAAAGRAGAEPLTLTATAEQSGWTGYRTLPFPLTATGWDYYDQPYEALTSLDWLAVTLTLEDGDTLPGNFDRDQLTLALDGIDTGIRLNGFGDGALTTLTVSGVPANREALLGALQQDGVLVGTIIDHTAGDNFLGIPAAFTTTLALQGEVPEPATWAVLALGLVGLVAWRRWAGA